MTTATPRLLADSSTVVKWELDTEPYASQAEELFQDWMQRAIHVCVPDQLFVEIVSALLGACRKYPSRLTALEAETALQSLLALPFTIFRTRGKALLARAFEIAHQYNQRAYDCVYVAIAERKRVDFWTSDERLYNSLHQTFPFVRWLPHYQRKRPS